MKKRIFLLFLLAALCFLFAGLASRSWPAGDGLLFYGRKLEQVLTSREEQSKSWLRRFSYRGLPSIDSLFTEAPEGTAFFLYSGDSLIYWSDPVIPQPRLTAGDTTTIQLLSDGYYLVVGHQGDDAGQGMSAYLLTPVFRSYPAEYPYLPNHFPALPSMPESIVFSPERPGIPVHPKGNGAWGYVNSSISLAHPLWSLLSLLLFLLGGVSLLSGAVFQARALNKWPFRMGWVFSGIMLFRLAGELTLFHSSAPHVFSSFSIRGTGSLIFNLTLLSFLLYWVSTEISRLRPGNYGFQAPFRKSALAALGYTGTVAGLLIFGICVRYIMLYSGLSFDFNDLFNLSSESFIVLIALLILPGQILELSQELTAYFHSFDLLWWKRLLLAAGGVSPVLLLAQWAMPEIRATDAIAISLFYLLLLDLYTDFRRESLTWLIIWLVFFSALSSALLFRYYVEGNPALAESARQEYDQPLALFSFLFVLLLVLVLIATSLRALLSGHRKWPHFSLRFRLQLTVTALIGGGFILIGIITVNSLQQSAREESMERLRDNVRTALRELSELQSRRDTGTELAELAFQLKKGRRMDVALYRSDGRLMAASGGVFSRQGLLPTRVAYELIHPPGSAGRQQVISKVHHSGGLSYQSVYADAGGSGPVHYIGLSFTSGEGAINRTLYRFLGTLVNIYVFLLLAASVVAIAVANSIARPLDYIGEKLQALGLGRNEPLEWQSDDEIGQLVRAYNEMIAKLEESTEKLRQSEREDAWREMARQVAHEIKNPLTPMKLSIQHLERVYQTDPARAADLIRRVTRTLVEQIDGLTRIANEFSSFAKMPKAENDYFTLDELVSSVFHLFRENPEHEALLELSLPSEQVVVFADRSQLMRVLNNLIKNALQSIPSERRGYIQVSLSCSGQQARLSVKDNGSGIAAEVRHKVFYPNFTTKSSGMGLGLAMCKNIVDLCGGKIWFETKEGEGTEFIVEIPVLKPEAGSRKSETVSNSDLGLPASGLD